MLAHTIAPHEADSLPIARGKVESNSQVSFQENLFIVTHVLTKEALINYQESLGFLKEWLSAFDAPDGLDSNSLNLRPLIWLAGISGS